MKLFRQILLCGVIWTLDLSDASAAADVNDVLTSALSELKSLKHDFHTTKERLITAEREIEKLKSDNQQLFNVIYEEERPKRSVSTSGDATSNNIPHLGTFHLSNISPKIEVCDIPRSLHVRSAGEHIAFTAYLSKTITELGRQHTIPFDLVLLNEGQAYDTTLHVFTCPVDGIYVFQSALMAPANAYIVTEIVKDGTAFVQMYGGGYSQGFNSATVQCNNGSRIWVRVLEHRGTSIYSELFSTFSGYLLWSV